MRIRINAQKAHCNRTPSRGRGYGAVKYAQANIRKIMLFSLAVFCLIPAVLVLSGTIISRYELGQCLEPLSSGAEGFITWKFLPVYPTFEHYARVLFYTPQFFVVFWNSIKIAVLILPAPAGSTGGLGFCGIQVPLPKRTVHPVRGPDADALPGYHAIQLLSTGRPAPDQYTWGHHPSGRIFHLPGFPHLPRILRPAREHH